MNFNYDNSINPNDNPHETRTGGGLQPEFKKFNKSLFDAAFRNYEEERQKADTNKDGTINTSEAKNYIRNISAYSSKNAIAVMKRIASSMGLVFVDHSTSEDKTNDAVNDLRDQTLKEFINFEKLDFNKDGVVGEDELKYGNEIYSSNVTQNFNNQRGLIDGQIVSHQGNKGDCWLLSTLAAISEKNPNLLKDMIKQDENGNVTVTIKGIFDEPFVFEVSKEQLQEARRNAYIFHSMDYEAYKKVKEDSIYSTDIDSIAIEMAIEAYDKYEKEQLMKPIDEYIKNSTFKEKLTTVGEYTMEEIVNMSDEQVLELFNQGKLRFTEEHGIMQKFLVPNKEGVIHPDSLREYDPVKIIKTTAQFFLDSDLSTDILYKENLFDVNSSLLEDFLSITEPNEGHKKLDLSIKDQRSSLSTANGSTGKAALKALFGDDILIEKYISNNSEGSKDQLRELINDFDKDSDKIYMLAFQKSFKMPNGNEIHARHEYYIDNIEKRNGQTFIIVADSHDSTVKEAIPLKTFLQNYQNILPATLPESKELA